MITVCCTGNGILLFIVIICDDILRLYNNGHPLINVSTGILSNRQTLTVIHTNIML